MLTDDDNNDDDDDDDDDNDDDVRLGQVSMVRLAQFVLVSILKLG